MLLEEPWVTADYPTHCRSAATALFDQAHATRPTTAAEQVAETCQAFVASTPWGWTPEHYDAAVGAVARAEHLRIEGFVGLSFGGRRLSYLHSAPPKWAVLANPAPLQRSGRAYVDGRYRAAMASVAERCGDCPDAAALLADLSREAAVLRAKPVPVAGRSVALTSADLGAAFLAVAYQEPADVPAAVASVVAPRVADHRALVGALADAVWSRFGTRDISPAYLAYLSEVCPAYPGWSPDAPSRDPVGRFLADWHSPCGHVDDAAVSRFAVRPTAATAICVTSAAGDPVAPPGSAATWRGPGTVVLPPRAGTQHNDWSGIEGLRRTAAPETGWACKPDGRAARL